MSGDTAVLASSLCGVGAALCVPVGPRHGPGRTRPSDPRRPDDSDATRPAMLGAVGAGVSVWLLLSALGPVAVLLAAVAAVAVHRWLVRREPAAVRRRRARIVRDLPLAVDLMAGVLEAGQPPSGAAATVAEVLTGPMSQELAEVARSLELGLDPVTVWRGLARHPQVGALGRALARATDSGAPVALALDRLAEDLRRDRRAAVEARARSVGVRAALPLGVCLLPAFVVLGVVPLVVGSLSVVLPR